MKKPEDMSLDEKKVLYYDTSKNLEVLQNNLNILIGLIEKDEGIEPEKKNETKP